MPSLLPERAISFSPSLAATLGLEEAVMLQGLQEISLHASTQHRDGDLQWQHAEQAKMRALFPFWTDQNVQSVVASLVEKGVLVLNSAPYTEVKHLYFALNDGDVRERRASKRTEQEAPLQNQAQAASTQPLAQPVPASSTIVAAPGSQGKHPIPAGWQPDADTRR
ncbi:MAG: hypothetical protein AB8B86_02130, partial [Pseudomonadales bacterium]